MDRTIVTFPLRASLAGTRLALRTTAGVAAWTLKLGSRTAVAATEAATRTVTRARTGDEPANSAPDLDTGVSASNLAVPEPSTGASAPGMAALQPDPGTPSAGTSRVEPESPRRVSEGLPDEPAALPEPAHVSEEPELVEELAEPGAEEGAGASIQIAEPWPGYRALSATEVIAGLDDATPAELAGIELYETANRHRQTVLDAAQRSLKTKTGRGSPDRTE